MHMTLIVTKRPGQRLDDIMNPFWQDLEVAPTWGELVSDEEKQRFLKHYREKYKCRLGFDKMYAKYGEDWNFNTWKKDSRGRWREWEKYNRNMKWDWYEVGGRWPGRLQLKKNAKTKPAVHFSWGWKEEEKEHFVLSHARCADRALKGEVANLKELTSYSLLIDGEWIDLGDTNDGEDSRVYDYLKDVEDNVELVCIDYHM